MKTLLNIAMILFVSVSLMGQDVVIEAKDNKTEIILTATNKEDTDVKVTVTFNVKGYDVGGQDEVEVLIPANQTIEVGRYKRDKSKMASFQYGYSLTTTTTTTESRSESKGESSSEGSDNMETENLPIQDESLKGVDGIVLYTMNQCGRCKFAARFFKENNIAFTEKNMDDQKENFKEAKKYLFDAGFGGGSFMTPVIVYDDKVSYNISDLKGFLNDLKK